MKRDRYLDLLKWKDDPYRTPLIVRGARQVGKTWLVREFGKSYPDFVEVNFERNPEFSEIFRRSLGPARIISELSAAVGKPIVPGKTLLFFDEIQQSPEALRSVRYFYEEAPDLHLIAAGSLLGFALEKISTGVGRLSYLNLYPMTFGEFLSATGNDLLREKIKKQDPGTPLLDIHHRKLISLVRDYMLVGGMPRVVKIFAETTDFLRCQSAQTNIIQSFLDDFVKYAKESEIPHLHKVFMSVSHQLSQKYVYRKVDPAIRALYLSNALDMLETAGIVYKVYHSKADGIPLQSRINSSRFKVIFFDVGLLQRIMNVDLSLWMKDVDISMVNRGAIAEQFVGQELAALTSVNKFSHLTYWHREKRGSSAELDYLIERKDKIIPIEVKSNVQGGMKSMRLFFSEKNCSYGIKISKYPFSFDGQIQTLPFYAVDRVVNG